MDARGDKGILASSKGITDADKPVIWQMGVYSCHQPGFDGAVSVFPLNTDRIGVARYYEVRDPFGRWWSHAVILVMSREAYQAVRCNPFVLTRAGLLDRVTPKSNELPPVDLRGAVTRAADDDRCLAVLSQLNRHTREQLVQSVLDQNPITIVTDGDGAMLAEAVGLTIPLPWRGYFYLTTCVLSSRDMPACTWRIAHPRMADEVLHNEGRCIVVGAHLRPVTAIKPYAAFIAAQLDEPGAVLRVIDAAERPLQGIDLDALPDVYNNYRIITAQADKSTLEHYLRCMENLINGVVSPNAPILSDLYSSLELQISRETDEQLRMKVTGLFIKLCNHRLTVIAHQACQRYTELLVALAPSNVSAMTTLLRMAADTPALRKRIVDDAFDVIKQSLEHESKLASHHLKSLVDACHECREVRNALVAMEVPVTCVELVLYSDDNLESRTAALNVWLDSFADLLVRATDFGHYLQDCLDKAPTWSKRRFLRLYDMAMRWAEVHHDDRALCLSLWRHMLHFAASTRCVDSQRTSAIGLQWYTCNAQFDNATWQFVSEVMHLNHTVGDELAQRYLKDLLTTCGYTHHAETVVDTLSAEQSLVLIHVMKADGIFRTDGFDRYLKACMSKTPHLCAQHLPLVQQAVLNWTELRTLLIDDVRSLWNDFFVFSLQYCPADQARVVAALWHRYACVFTPDTWRFIMAVMSNHPSIGSDRARAYLSDLLSSLDHWGHVQQVIDEFSQRDPNDVVAVLGNVTPRNPTHRQFLLFVCTRLFEALASDNEHLALPAAQRCLDLISWDALPSMLDDLVAVAPASRRISVKNALLEYAVRKAVLACSITHVLQLLNLQQYQQQAWTSFIKVAPRTLTPNSTQHADFVRRIFTALTQEQQAELAHALLRTSPRDSEVWRAIPSRFHPEPPKPFPWARLAFGGGSVVILSLAIWMISRGFSNYRPPHIIVFTNEPLRLVDIPASSQSFWRSVLSPLRLDHNLTCVIGSTTNQVQLSDRIDDTLVSNIVRHYTSITNSGVSRFIGTLAVSEANLGLPEATNALIQYSSGAVTACVKCLPADIPSHPNPRPAPKKTKETHSKNATIHYGNSIKQ